MTTTARKTRFAAWVSRALLNARASGMNDADIARATKMAASTFHRWQKGENRPSVELVEQFCRGLGIDSDEGVAALRGGRRASSTEAPMDTDVLKIVARLADPTTPPEHLFTIHATLRALNQMLDAQEAAVARPGRARKAR